MTAAAHALAALGAYLADLRIEERREGFLRASAVVREDCPVLRGHFPGRPILPGAFHVWIAGLLAAHLLAEGQIPRLYAVEKARFRRPLTPRDRITVTVKAAGEAGHLSVRCRIEKDGDEASRFHLSLERQGP